jgi:hypothetical protein
MLIKDVNSTAPSAASVMEGKRGSSDQAEPKLSRPLLPSDEVTYSVKISRNSS